MLVLVVHAALYDSELVWSRCFDVEWQVVASTPAFARMLSTVRVGLDELRDTLRRRYTLIWTLFQYYACVSAGDTISMLSVCFVVGSVFCHGLQLLL